MSQAWLSTSIVLKITSCKEKIHFCNVYKNKLFTFKNKHQIVNLGYISNLQVQLITKSNTEVLPSKQPNTIRVITYQSHIHYLTVRFGNQTKLLKLQKCNFTVILSKSSYHQLIHISFWWVMPNRQLNHIEGYYEALNSFHWIIASTYVIFLHNYAK